MSKLEELCERLKELDREAAKVALEIHREREREKDLLNVLANGGTYVDRAALENLRLNVRVCSNESMKLPQ